MFASYFSLYYQDPDFPRMDYSLPISLKHTCLVKIATLILDHSRVRIEAWNSCLGMPDTLMYKKRKKWLPVENVVINRADDLSLPHNLKTELRWFVTGTSWELFLYLDFHRNKCKIISRMPDKFVWTKQGTIDRKKTARLLVADENLDVLERYKLACLYCLESDIVALWNHLHVGKNFINTLWDKKLDTLPLVSYWSHHVAGQLKLLQPFIIQKCSTEDSTHYEYAFRISIDMDNAVAVRYFYEKLNSEEKEWLPLDTVILHRDLSHASSFLEKRGTGILYFFLQVIDGQKQSKLFHWNSGFVFSRFLDWPLQSLFIKVVEQYGSYLSEKVFCYLLKCISTRNKMGCKDYDYQQLYGELWKLMTPSYKRYIIENHMNEDFLLHLFDLGDWHNIALIFGEMSSAEKEAFIFSEDGQALCKRLIFSYHYDVLKFFILMCISSRKKVLKFRRLLVKWQEDEEDSGLSEDEYDYTEDEDILIPGEAYCLLEQAVETLDDLLIEKYKRSKDKDAPEST